MYSNNAEQSEAQAVENYRKFVVSHGCTWLGYEVDEDGILVVSIIPPRTPTKIDLNLVVV